MDDSAATTVEDLVDEAAVVRVEWEVLSTTGNAGVFSELLGEDPTLEEMQGHGVFECTQHLIAQFKGRPSPLSVPEASPYFPPSPLPTVELPRQSFDLQTRPTLLPAARHSSPRLSPLAMVRKATRIRPKPSSRTQSTSDLPKAQVLLASFPSSPTTPSAGPPCRSASPLRGFVRSRRQSDISDGRVSRQSSEAGGAGTIVVQDLSTTRKLKKARSPPSTLRPDDLVAGPSYSSAMSTEPDPMSPILSAPTYSPRPLLDSRRPSWRTSLSSLSSASTPDTPAFEHHSISRTRSSSPVTGFPSAAPRSSALRPIEQRKSKRSSRSSSADSYNADAEGSSSNGRSRVAGASVAITKGKWVKALSMWGGKKGESGRQSLEEDASNTWNWLDGDEAVEGRRSSSKSSFEVLRRPSVLRTQSNGVLEVSKTGRLRDELEALAFVVASTSSPNLSKIEEHPEPATIRRSSPLQPSVSSSHDHSTPIPSLPEKTAPSTPRTGRSSTIEFGRVSTSRIRSSSTASLLSISRPPSPPFASAHSSRPSSPGISLAITPIPLATPPLLPLRARELFFAGDDPNREATPAVPSTPPPRHTWHDSPIPPTPDLVRSRPTLFRHPSSPSRASLILHPDLLHDSRPRGRTLSAGAHPSDSETSWRSSTSEGEDTPASSAEQEDEDLSPREEAELAKRLARSDGLEGLWKRREVSEESNGLGEEGIKVW